MTPIAIGADIIEVSRIRATLARHGARFIERCFCEAEQRDCERSGEPRSAERYAARFAAKEAAAKALGTGISLGIAWRDFEIVTNDLGAPSLRLCRRAEEIAAEQGIRAWLCSLSHTSDYAVATIIAMG